MKDVPLVSICIPSYNREHIIAHTIETVINQTYKNIEIIISDNCSTDKTFEIIKKYSLKDNRIKIFQMKKNVGPVENWKKCYKKSNGTFIKFLWSDDFIDKNFIEKAIEKFEDDIGFVYTPVKWYDVKSMKINHDNIGFKLLSSSTLTLDLFIESLIIKGNAPVSASCAIFRKHIIDDLFGSDIKNSLALDYGINGAGFDALMFLYVTKQYSKFAYTADIFAYYGVDNDSITVRDGEKLIPYYFSVFYDFLKEFKHDDKLLSSLKTKVFFYKVFIVKDSNTKKLLNKLFNLIDAKVNSIYFINLIIKELFMKKSINIIHRVMRKVFVK